MTPREFRRAELRAASGRRVLGPVMVYGSTATVVHPSGRIMQEKFTSSAFSRYLGGGGGTVFNLNHDRAIKLSSTRDGNLVLTDLPHELRMVATLPVGDPYDEALSLVADGSAAETSIEFVAEQEHVVGDKRLVLDAQLPGLAVVPAGAYGGKVEVRAGGVVMVRGRVPLATPMQCECVGPKCKSVIFDMGAFDDLPDQALAVAGSYNTPLAALSRDTLRLDVRDGALQVEVDLPDTDAGKAIIEAAAAAPLFVRPYLDQNGSDFDEEGDLRTYHRAMLRAIIVGATDASGGHVEAEIIEPRASIEHPNPWYGRLWL